MASLAVPGVLAAGALYSSASTIPRPPLSHRRSPIPWRKVWERSQGFGAIIVLRNLGAASLLTLLPLVWHQRGGSPTQAGTLLAVVYAAGMIGNLIGGSLSDKWGVRWVLVGSLVGAGISAAVGGMTTTGTGWAFWIAVAIWGFTVNGAGAAMLVYGQSMFPDKLGLGSGLTMGLGNTVGAFGAWGVGAIAQWHGLSLAIDVAAGCLVLGVIPALTSVEDAKESRPGG